MSNVTPTSPAVPTTITNLPAAASVGTADLLPIVQSGVTKKATAAQFASAIQSASIVGSNGVSAATAAGVTTVSGITATSSQIGVVKPDGTTITASGGTISVPTATSGNLGLVEPDGTIITVSGGAITVPKASNSAFGVVEVDNTTITSAGGVISAVQPAAGAMVFISQVAINTSTASAQFTSGITNSYNHYILEISELNSASNAVDILVQLQQNSGFVSTGYYSAAIKFTASGSVAGASQSNAGSFNITGGTGMVSSQNGSYTVARFEFWSPTTSLGPTVQFDAANNPQTSSSTPSIVKGGGYVNQSSFGTTGLQVTLSSGNIVHGLFKLYGIT